MQILSIRNAGIPSLIGLGKGVFDSAHSATPFQAENSGITPINYFSRIIILNVNQYQAFAHVGTFSLY
jgi:hypothetical protein